MNVKQNNKTKKYGVTNMHLKVKRNPLHDSQEFLPKRQAIHSDLKNRKLQLRMGTS